MPTTRQPSRPRPPRKERSASSRRGPKSALLLALLAVLALSAGQVGAQQPLVLSTVGMIGDVVAELAGECARSETLVGPGGDPHLFRASAGDVRIMGQADLIFYVGLHLEAGLASVLANFADRTPTVAVAEVAVPEEALISQEASVYDPHVWMDVSLWRGVVPVVAGTLTEALDLDEACAQQVAERTESYAQLLGELHAWAGAAIATIPEEHRILVTAHDAFEYFGRAYDIEVEGIQGISTETEAAVADIRRVAQLVVERGVPALFVESTINPRTVTAVLEAVEQRGGSAVLGDQLYADSPGAKGSMEGTYVGMVVHNVRAITTALGGSVPPLQGALAEWEARW